MTAESVGGPVQRRSRANRGLCENIVESQRREIQQMETWLCQWYRVCSASER